MLKEELEETKQDGLNSHKNERFYNDLERKCSVYESTFKKLVEVIYLEERKRGLVLLSFFF
jgi:hypothetical protein